MAEEQEYFWPLSRYDLPEVQYFCGTGAAGRGPRFLNVVASWVKACEYLSLGLHVGNHSKPTPLTIISFVVVVVVVVVVVSCFFTSQDGL